MNKNDFKPLSSYSKEEVKEAIMSQVNWLAAIGFSVKRAESLQFRCSQEGKTIIFNDRKVTLEGVDPDSITIDLMYHGSDGFRKILIGFEVIKKYSEGHIFPANWGMDVASGKDETVLTVGEFKVGEPIKYTQLEDMLPEERQKWIDAYQKKGEQMEENINNAKRKLVSELEFKSQIRQQSKDGLLEEIQKYKYDRVTIGHPEQTEVLMESDNDTFNITIIATKAIEDIKKENPDATMQEVGQKIHEAILGKSFDDSVKEVITEHENAQLSTVEVPIEEGITEVITLPKGQDVFKPSYDVHLCQGCHKRPFSIQYQGKCYCGSCYNKVLNLI